MPEKLVPNALDISGYAEIKIEFWYRPESIEADEDFWLHFYDGSSWQTMQQIKLELIELSPGVYMVHIRSKNERAIEKLIIR